MRFLGASEELIARSSELTGEEFRLYTIIIFYTVEGVCHKSIAELAALSKLSYNTIAVRVKVLKQKKWLADFREITPLVGLKKPETIYL